MELLQATTDADYAAARVLFEEYAASLGFSLCFQGFDQEIENLPQVYGPPAGVLLLARDDGVEAGCVALRPAGDGACEMKRLYVRPPHRGTGLGRRLAETILVEAQRSGYDRMLLHTMESMERAHALYRALGFVDSTPPPGSDAPEGSVYMELDLAGVRAA